MPNYPDSMRGSFAFLIPLLMLGLQPVRALDYKSTEGFYKSVFRDGGEGLDSYHSFFAVESLGLSFEHLATSGIKTTTDRIEGTPGDSNGVLLYPDGAPRFRLLFVNGGNSNEHGGTLIGKGHKRIQDFYHNGGSYAGSCAGAHLATLSTTLPGIGSVNANYFHLWPGRTQYTQLNIEGGTTNFTSFKIPARSPLWKYYDFGPDSSVEKVFHNGGSFVIPGDDFFWVPGTEILATYSAPITYSNTNAGRDLLYQGFLGNGSIWAFKEADSTGRLVLGGSHPEGFMNGERLTLTKGIVRYALDGQGKPRIKGSLEKGVNRVMNDNANPGFEKIGDLQYHHFTVPVRSADSLVITLKGGVGYDFHLFVSRGAPAFASTATYRDTSSKVIKKIVIKNAQAGLWYVGVQCVTTIKAVSMDHGYDYTDNAKVLNGAPYEIMASGFEPDATPTLNKSPVAAKGVRFSALRTAAGLSFQVSLPRPAAYRLSLVDMSGHTLWKRQLPASALSGSGEQTLPVEGRFPAGVVFAILESDAGRSMEKIIVRN